MPTYVMFIYRDDYYHSRIRNDKNIAEIIIAKQRNGPIGTVELDMASELHEIREFPSERGKIVPEDKRKVLPHPVR